jgi:rare lipoprotein A
MEMSSTRLSAFVVLLLGPLAACSPSSNAPPASAGAQPAQALATAPPVVPLPADSADAAASAAQPSVAHSPVAHTSVAHTSVAHSSVVHSSSTHLAAASHSTAALDHSGREQTGSASFYGPGFAGRKMADGRRMDPQANVIASKTLPLGSTARVTNAATGESVVVTVEDRGKLPGGRVADVSPHVAKELALTKEQGVAPVVVTPITVPQANGSVKLGAGAAGASPQEVDEATAKTKGLTGGTSSDAVGAP